MMNASARGTTIIEGMTVIGIMMIVLVMVNQIFVSGYDLFVKQAARVDVENGVVLAARAVTDATRGATAIETSAVINGTTYTTGPETLVLQIPSLDASDDVIAGSYDLVAVYRDGSNPTLIKTDTAPGTGSVRPSGQRIITANNDVLRFRYNDPTPANANRVQMYLRNTLTTRSTVVSARIWTAIFLRNH